MNDVQSIRHTVWECKYHGVRIPKCRRKVLYGQLRQYLGEVFRELVRQRESEAEEVHLRFGSCAYVGLDPAQVCRCRGGGVCEGEACDVHRPEFYRPEAELRG